MKHIIEVCSKTLKNQLCQFRHNRTETNLYGLSNEKCFFIIIILLLLLLLLRSLDYLYSSIPLKMHLQAPAT